MLGQYVPNLRRYRAIALDVGDKDGLVADLRVLDRLMTEFGVAHSFEVYDGNHVNNIDLRFEKNVLPFFSQHLDFGARKR